MKSGISIMNPTSDDLAKYELSREIGSNEKAFWLGSPDMRYVFTLASSTGLLMVLGGSAYWVIKCSIEFGLSGDIYALRGIIIFGCTFTFTFIFNIVVIAKLRSVIYMVTDKYIYILIRGVGSMSLYRGWGEACCDGRGRLLEYGLSQLSYYQTYSSIIDSNIGNIFLSPPSKYFPDQPGRVVTIEKQTVLFTSITRIFDALYAVANVSQLCDIIKNATISARSR